MAVATGYGYGDGSGSGYGYGFLLPDALAPYKEHPTLAAFGPEVTLGIWRSGVDGQPTNGGKRGEPARPGLLQETEGPLRICTRNALHATLRPQNWKGERWWIVALLGEVQHRDNKMGALRRVIVAEMA